MAELTSSPWFQFGFVPLLIFLARTADMTLSTMRIIFVSRGLKIGAAAVGFFEVLIWLFAITQVLHHLSSPLHYIAYAGGFSCGCFFGMCIEEKLAMGKLVVRIITQRPADNLIKHLNLHGHGVTSIDGVGRNGPVKVIFTIVNRRNLPSVADAIDMHNPRAFYTVEDIRGCRDGVFTDSLKRDRPNWFGSLLLTPFSQKFPWRVRAKK